MFRNLSLLTTVAFRGPSLIRCAASTRNIVDEQRAALLGRLFLAGVPKIWCQPLVHLKSDGSVDESRVKAHFESVYPHVRGFYVPHGCHEEAVDGRNYLQLLTGLTAIEPNLHVLVGAAASTTESSCELILDTLSWMRSRVNANMPSEFAMKAHTVCGFGVSPPATAHQMTDEELRDAFADVFALDVPIAIVQRASPAINQLSFGAFDMFRQQYPSLFAVLDWSGTDNLACQLHDLRNGAETPETHVKLFRGVDSDYDVWLQPNGPYDALLSHSANCFAPQLDEIVRLIQANDVKQANQLSRRLSNVVHGVMSLLTDTSLGIDAGHYDIATMTVIDQVMAYGAEDAVLQSEPMLVTGIRIPKAVRSLFVV